MGKVGSFGVLQKIIVYFFKHDYLVRKLSDLKHFTGLIVYSELQLKLDSFLDCRLHSILSDRSSAAVRGGSGRGGGGVIRGGK